jgi:hypothetical protein
MWIRDILVRIGIRGSVTLTHGSDSGPNPAFFVFLKSFIAYYFLKVHKSAFTKEYILRFFLLFLLVDGRSDPDPYKIMKDPDPDPDP